MADKKEFAIKEKPEPKSPAYGHEDYEPSKAQFIVKTDSPEFNGKAFGVKFHQGRAILNEMMIDHTLGRSVEEIAYAMEHELKGYTVKTFDPAMATVGPAG